MQYPIEALLGLFLFNMTLALLRECWKACPEVGVAHHRRELPIPLPAMKNPFIESSGHSKIEDDLSRTLSGLESPDDEWESLPWRWLGHHNMWQQDDGTITLQPE